MKYRPSKWFLGIVGVGGLASVVLWFGILPDLDEARAVPASGEIVFREVQAPVPGKAGGRPVTFSISMGGLQDWLNGSLDDLMRWEHNPWRRTDGKPYPGAHFLSLLASKDPVDVAKAREIQRLAEAWLKRLMERYPEMAVERRPVADERNGFLKWLEFSERMKALAGPHEAASMRLDKTLTDYFGGHAAWDPVAARAWLEANAGLMEELRGIGRMEEASIDGIAADRYTSVEARLAQDAARALMLEARLAAEGGDVSAAMESLSAIRGLIGHLSNIESPTLLTGTVQIFLQQELERRVFSEILPVLPPGSRDAAAWEAVVNAQVSAPAEYARLMKGEWSMVMRQWILPSILDAGEPVPRQNPGDLIDAYSLHYREVVMANEGLGWSDELPRLTDPSKLGFQIPKDSAITLSSMVEASNSWRTGFSRSPSAQGLTQAAFAILKGQAVPVDPVWGKPYQWDAATRTLSMPAGARFDEMKIPSIVVPGW